MIEETIFRCGKKKKTDSRETSEVCGCVHGRPHTRPVKIDASLGHGCYGEAEAAAGLAMHVLAGDKIQIQPPFREAVYLRPYPSLSILSGIKSPRILFLSLDRFRRLCPSPLSFFLFRSIPLYMFLYTECFRNCGA